MSASSPEEDTWICDICRIRPIDSLCLKRQELEDSLVSRRLNIEYTVVSHYEAEDAQRTV